MRWDNCFSEKRTGVERTKEQLRTEYQRDFDRLIFSSSFRRLQNKTQVFPLPGTSFVHNRLTHSLEVASVGRSIGALVGRDIAETEIKDSKSLAYQFYMSDLSAVVAAACLAHDIGNPAFGHSGEKAISNYFIEHAELDIEGQSLKQFFSKSQWSDLINFEGNANALRTVTHQFKGKFAGGMQLTHATLAGILKYPGESLSQDKNFKHRKKYGFFQADKATFLETIEECKMIRDTNTDYTCYLRHPFVYLVEAADDICYRIIDMEDGHRLGIVSKEMVSEAFLSVIESINHPNINLAKTKKTFAAIQDDNDSISYLRAKCINLLVLECAQVFLQNKNAILTGSFNDTLIDNIEQRCGALKEVIDISVSKIYNHPSVIEIEIAGYNVMSRLLNLFIPAVLRNNPLGTDGMAMKLIPYQFTSYADTDDPYLKVLSIVDFISGMTDSYATEFYRKTMGIEIPRH